MPDFFIVGHPKSGTTALYEMLKHHPQIYMPELKEPWYFASDMLPRFQPPRSAPPLETLEDYRALFADAAPEQRIGEASSSYLLLAHGGRADRARCGPTRASSRSCASRRASCARCTCSCCARTSRAEQDLRKAIALEAARREGKQVPRRSHRPQLLLYSDHVRYVEQLRRYHDVFPPEQVLVLIYDDFRARQRGDRAQGAALPRRRADAPVDVLDANPTIARMRSQQLDELLNVVSVGTGPGLARGQGGAQGGHARAGCAAARCGATQRHLVMGTPQPPDEELMLQLRRRFKGEVVALSEYLDRDLVALWGYDRLD